MNRKCLPESQGQGSSLTSHLSYPEPTLHRPLFIFPLYTVRVGFSVPLCKVHFFLLPVEPRMGGPGFTHQREMTKCLSRCPSGFSGWCPLATHLPSPANW